MNKLGVFSDFTEEYDISKRLKMIKEAGFDSVMLNSDVSVNKLSFDKQVELCRKLGLNTHSAHLSFIGINQLWQEDKSGDDMIDMFISQVDACAKNGVKIAIMHLSSGLTPPAVNKIGLARLAKLFAWAQSCGVVLALENLRKTDYVVKVMDAIKGSSVGMCYDCGHENIYNKGQRVAVDLCKQVKLTTVHLHDNDGIGDLHCLPYDGNINWDNVLGQIAELKYDDVVLLEVMREKTDRYQDLTAEQYLAKAYKLAVDLATRLQSKQVNRE